MGHGLHKVMDLYGLKEFNETEPNQIYLKFLGGPPTINKSRSIWTASLKCYLIDCTLREFLNGQRKKIYEALANIGNLQLLLDFLEESDILLLEDHRITGS
jgi:hypothetical protein